MLYINKNITLNQLKEVVAKNINQRIDYMPSSFNEEQKKALELFQKRIYLEEIIEETISFNKNLSWEDSIKNLYLTTTAESLVDVFKLRSDIYGMKNYQHEFPDEIEGLNFDSYDKYSAILYYKSNQEVTGSIRLIFDTENNLPSEKNSSLSHLRQTHKIAELSRQVVKQTNKGLGLEFKNFYKGIYHLTKQNNEKVNLILASITSDHEKLYQKFGGITIEDRLKAYGKLEKEILLLSWDIEKISKFFQRGFL